MSINREFLKTTQFKHDIFKGKVVFVTGGAGSICRVQTEAMVLLGANATIIGRNKDKTEKAAREMEALRPGSKVLGLGGVDVRDVHSLEQAVATTVEKLGRIDYVICGAAGNFLSDFNNLSSNAFKSVVSIDLLGSFNTVKATYPQLVKHKGSIIFVSTTLHYYGVPFQAHVGAAKAGIDALSNALAVELGPLGIRSNCIAPGMIKDTEGFDRLSAGKSIEQLTRTVPLQRPGYKEDIANATVFLFSDAASYITGDVLVVDGAAWHMGQCAAMDAYPEQLKERLLGPPKL
jgi:peroxisomal 2,4-dienoyl-CoA reductase